MPRCPFPRVDRWPAEKVALSPSHPEPGDCSQFGLCFDAFRDESGADPSCELHQCCAKGPLAPAIGDPRDKAAVHLDDVGPDVEDVAHGGEARAGVVDGNAQPALPQRRQGSDEGTVLRHFEPFGQLQYHPVQGQGRTLQ